MAYKITTNFERSFGKPLDLYGTVADITARNAIPAGVRYLGMSVYVESEQIGYRLQGGLLDANWVRESRLANGSLVDLALSFIASPTTGFFRKVYGGVDSALTFVLDGSQKFEVQKDRVVISKEIYAEDGTMDLVGGAGGTGTGIRTGNYSTITSGNLHEWTNGVPSSGGVIQAFMTFQGGLFQGTNANLTDFSRGFSVTSESNTGYAQAASTKYGHIVETAADGTNGAVSVWGITKTSGANGGSGVAGYAGVANTNDSGTATAGTFSVIETHAGGDNVAVQGSALNLGQADGLGAFCFKSITGVHQTGGGYVYHRTPVNNVNHTANAADYIIAYTNLTATKTVSLKNVLATQAGRMFIIKDESGLAGTYPIVLQPETNDRLIDGQQSYSINVNYGSVTIYSDGTNWFIL